MATDASSRAIPSRRPPPADADVAAALGSGMRPPWHPDEPMTLVAFRELKAAFDAADEDGGGELDVDEFVATFRRIVPDATRSELRALFAKIDTNSSETVDWDEFSSYVLLAEDANERMRGDRGGATYAPPDRSMRALFDNRTRHKDLMTRVTRLPKTDQYASVSRDGTLRVWNHERAAAASGKTSKHSSAAVAAAVGGKLADALLPPFSLHRVVHPGSAYLNDAALLPVTDRLAVASHDRCVRVYETKGWTESGASRSFDHAPLCLAAFAGGRRVAPGARDVDHLIVGDDGGALHLLDVIDLTDGEKAEVGGTASVKIQRRWRKKIHDGWVHALARCDAGDAPGTPGFVASGGADCCLRLTDLATGACFKTFGPNAQTSNPHVKAIHAVAFCASTRCVFTGGDDRVVRVWTPLSNGPSATLLGHDHTVCDILAVPEEHQVLTLDVSKTIRVWDVRTNRCAQTFRDAQTYHPEDRLGRLTFDAKRRQLVSGGVQPKTWALADDAVRVAVGHNHAVKVAGFSRPYRRVVTADAGGRAVAWRVDDGECAFRFEGAADGGGDAAGGRPRGEDDEDAAGNDSDDSDSEDERRGPKVTAGAVDAAGRRLVIGASDGRVHLWNFTNGERAGTLAPEHAPDPSGAKRVTSVAHLVTAGSESGGGHRKFVAVGWNKALTTWDDEPGSSSSGSSRARASVGTQSGASGARPKRVARRHAADALCVATNADGSALATGDADGVVLVWNENGALRHRLTLDAEATKSSEGGSVDAKSANANAPPGSKSFLATDRAAECCAFFRSRDESLREDGEDDAAAPFLRRASSSGKESASSSGKAPSECLVVGHADGRVRFWSVADGRLVAAFHAGHRAGEGVVAVAANAAGTRMLTADGVGRARLWNLEPLRAALSDDGPLAAASPPPLEEERQKKSPVAAAENERQRRAPLGRDRVECLGYWQAHAIGTCVNAAHFFELEETEEEEEDGEGEEGGLETTDKKRRDRKVVEMFVTAGEDRRAHLWSADGAHVGQFGRDTWRLDDATTWRSSAKPPGGDKDLPREAEEEGEERRDEAARAPLAAAAAPEVSRSPSEVRPKSAAEEAGPDARERTRREAAERERAEQERAEREAARARAHAAAASDEEAAAAEASGAPRRSEAAPAEAAPEVSAPEVSARESEAARAGVSAAPDSVSAVPDSDAAPESEAALAPESEAALAPESSDVSARTASSARTAPPPEPSEPTLLFPEPSGYLPVRPVEDRALWTSDVASSFEASRTHAALRALDAKKRELKTAGLAELRARSEKLNARKPGWHERVFVPGGDEHLNKPNIPGRPYQTVHHVLKISDVGDAPAKPGTKKGQFRYRGRRGDE